MGKQSYFPMEFSVFVMISVAIFLAYGESPPVKSGDKSDAFLHEISSRSPKSKLQNGRDKEQSDFSKERFSPENDEANAFRFISPISEIEPIYDEDETEENIRNFEKRMNAKKQYNRKFKYDPALALMGLGKRSPQYDPAMMYMGLGKRSPQYDPAMMYMGLGKRMVQYDPALKYMGLGKRMPQYDPALKYMGLGKRAPQYDPALKYMGLGKRASQYDPALKYMGLGKRASQYDPALKYMGLGKRASQYDPALKYMGLGKRIPEYHSSSEYSGPDKRFSQYDPALKYMGLGKRDFQYDPALKYMGIGKRGNSYDPGLMYMGLGKRNSAFDPGLKYMGLGKRDSMHDYQGELDYENDSEPLEDDTFIEVGEIPISELQKRKAKYDPALSYMGLGKRKIPYDPSVKYVDSDGKKIDDGGLLLYKKAYSMDSEDDSVYDDSQTTKRFNVSKSGKRGLRYNSRLPNKMISKGYITDKFENIPGLGKRPYKFDPALRLMGLGKRNYYTELGKRPYKYDPALKYMGLGKRGQSETVKDSDTQGPSLSDIFNEEETTYLKLNLSDFEENKSSSNASETPNEKPGYFTSINDEMDSEENSETHKAPQSFQKRYTPNVMSMGVDALTNKYNPTLLYRGLGKRRNIYDHRMYYHTADEDDDEIKNDSSFKYIRLDRPAVNNNENIGIDFFELSKHPNKTNDCGDKCLKRIKRHIKSKSEVQSEDVFDQKGLGAFFLPTKRERDNRPRYNPGWIFIGLGKRSERSTGKETETDPDFIKYNMSLDDYYVLLDRIKENIEKMKLKHGLSNSSKDILLKVEPDKSNIMMETDGYWHDEEELPYASDDTPPNTWLKILPNHAKK